MRLRATGAVALLSDIERRGAPCLSACFSHREQMKRIIPPLGCFANRNWRWLVLRIHAPHCFLTTAVDDGGSRHFIRHGLRRRRNHHSAWSKDKVWRGRFSELGSSLSTPTLCCYYHVRTKWLCSINTVRSVKFFNRLFGRDDANEIPADELSHWVTAEAENSGTRVIFRLRTAQPPIADIGSYTSGISIRWHYDSMGSGMPPGDVNAQQVSFEEAIDELTMYNGHSFLMLVSTGLDYKEWVFYSKDRDRFMNGLNSALEDHPKYPLKIEFYDDPEWKIWREVLARIDRERI